VDGDLWGGRDKLEVDGNFLYDKLSESAVFSQFQRCMLLVSDMCSRCMEVDAFICGCNITAYAAY
jgi:hypothetical protein